LMGATNTRLAIKPRFVYKAGSPKLRNPCNG
jgi:hypothetical protein